MSSLTNEFGQPVGPEVPSWAPPARPARRTMHGAYCTVEPLEPGRHLPGLFEAFGGADSDWTYLRYGPFSDMASLEEWARATCLGDDPLFFALLDNETGKPGGVASYLRITPQSGTIEVGHIHLGSPLKRSRAGTEAMFLMMEYAFSLGYRRYEWKCDALNGLSRAAALRLGFTFEGTWRQATVNKGAIAILSGSPSSTPTGPDYGEDSNAGSTRPTSTQADASDAGCKTACGPRSSAARGAIAPPLLRHTLSPCAPPLPLLPSRRDEASRPPAHRRCPEGRPTTPAYYGRRCWLIASSHRRLR